MEELVFSPRKLVACGYPPPHMTEGGFNTISQTCKQLQQFAFSSPRGLERASEQNRNSENGALLHCHSSLACLRFVECSSKSSALLTKALPDTMSTPSGQSNANTSQRQGMSAMREKLQRLKASQSGPPSHDSPTWTRMPHSHSSCSPGCSSGCSDSSASATAGSGSAQSSQQKVPQRETHAKQPAKEKAYSAAQQQEADSRKAQRDNRGLWKSSWLFPLDYKLNGPNNLLCSDSAENTSKFICCGSGGNKCMSRKCLHAIKPLHIALYRNELVNSSFDGHGHKEPFLVSKLAPVFDRTTLCFVGGVPVVIPGHAKIEVCATAFAVLSGCTASTWQKVKQKLKGEETVPVPRTATPEVVTLGCQMVRTYISQVIAKAAEQNPAPGASSGGKEAVVHKKSWQSRRNDAELWFRSPDGSTTFPGPFLSMKKFKELWRNEKCLKEKQACSHSKCDICSGIDNQLEKLRGKNTEGAQRRREDLLTLRRNHDAFHMGEREHFDKACLTSIKNPKDMWVIIADGATQRNFGAFQTCKCLCLLF